MFRSTRSQPRRLVAATGLALATLATLAASAAMTQAQSPSPERGLANRIPAATYHVDTAKGDIESAYFAEFVGVGAEGRDMVWRGAIAGAAVGELVVLLAPEGRVADTARPEWPVEGIIFVTGEDPRRAFAAEVRGTIDWQRKRLTLAGEVSVGHLRGARVEQTADLIDHDLSGELRLMPGTLATATRAGALR